MFLILKISYPHYVRTCIAGYFSIVSIGSDVRPVLVKSTKVSLYNGILFGGGVEGGTNVISDSCVFFFPAIEETSEALSGSTSSLSERYESFPSLSSRTIQWRYIYIKLLILKYILSNCILIIYDVLYLLRVVGAVLLYVARSCVSLPEETHVFSYKLPVVFASKITSNSDDVSLSSSKVSHFNAREDLIGISISEFSFSFSRSFSCIHKVLFEYTWIYICTKLQFLQKG